MTELLRIAIPLAGLLFLFHLTFAHPMNQTEDEDSNTTITFKVSDLGFKANLENPCAFLDSNYSFAVADASENVATVMSDLSYRTSLVQEAARELVHTEVLDLQNCSGLQMPTVAVIPTLSAVNGSGTVDVLQAFYTSLLNHTAHTYFLLEQLDRHSSDDCESTNNTDFARKARTLASHMRQLMCFIRRGIGALGSSSGFGNSTKHIFEEELVNQPLCSRRTVRDCQIAISTRSLVRTLSAYVVSKM